MFLPIELGFFEKLFEMDDGFVLDFSKAGLNNFIRNSVNMDVNTKEYLTKVKKRYNSQSNANILRYFWENEDSSKILKLMYDLIDYYEENGFVGYYEKEDEIIKAKIILNKYYNPTKIQNVLSDEKRIIDLIDEINFIIEERKPIFAVDKLHTLVHNILRKLCRLHGISFNKHDRIDELFKKYEKFLEKNNFIESKMTKSIIKQTGSLLSQFNDIRNNNTYAHDNPVLNQFESEFIYKQVLNTLYFIDAVDNSFKLEGCCNLD